MEVRYEGIAKRFGATQALEPLDLVVPDGTFLAMLGPSGCGKTTALRVLAGLEAPTEGRVFIGERDVTRLEPKDRDVAMVFQSYALYPHKTVGDNIGYPLRVRRISKAERADQVKRVAELLEIENLLGRMPRQLSGGQRQRVALARAIIRRPQAFLMDEPLSNLDALLRGQMRIELKRLQRELGVTTLYVTHDQVEAMTMADLVAVMRDGRLQQLAEPKELYRRPANLFVARFCGAPPMNVLGGEVADGAFRHAAGAVTLGRPARPGATKLGFRPEHAALVEPGAADALDGELYVVEPLVRDPRRRQRGRGHRQRAPARGLRGPHPDALPRAAREVRGQAHVDDVLAHADGELYVVEPLGNETLAAVSVGEDIVNVRLPADFAGRAGERVGVRPERIHLHLFDPDSGDALGAPPARDEQDNIEVGASRAPRE